MEIDKYFPVRIKAENPRDLSNAISPRDLIAQRLLLNLFNFIYLELAWVRA